MKLDMKKPEDKPTFEDPAVAASKEAVAAGKEVVDSIEDELTDEQLLQMAEGTCSWGANCNKGQC